jgi:transposase-like protein
MKKTAKRNQNQAQSLHNLLSPAQVQEDLMERCKLAALRIGTDLLEEEVRALCGAEYSRKGEGQCYRGGSDRTRIIIDGGKFSITRPRVRNETGEVQLDMLDKLQHQDLLDEKMKRAMISGVSSRQYHEVVQGYSDKLSVSKSSVSRAFTRASQKDLDAINGSELSEHSFVALMLDGFEIGGQMIIAALGITNKMEKIPLGLKEGSSENAEVTTDLLTSIKERGFTTATSFFLAVIDGSKALRKALKQVFGDKVLIQRCWLHKLRNLKKYVPDKLHGTLLWRLKKIMNLTSLADAEKEMDSFARWLEGVSHGALESLKETAGELLTLHALGTTGILRRSLNNTNMIESMIAGARRRLRKVTKLSPKSNQRLRWAASSILAQQKGFQRLRGYKDAPGLIAALTDFKLESLAA